MFSKFDHNVDSFVCFNYPQLYKPGSISLPRTIIAKYGGKIPKRIFVELPTGALWRGSYSTGQHCLVGLECLFNYYDVKQYHFFVLFYGGGNKFSLEIFNVYGVEIFYKVCSDLSPVKEVTPLQAVWLNDCYYLNTDFDLDKLHGQFIFNCYNASSESYDVVVDKQHLQAKVYNQILCKSACNKLGLEEYTTSVEIGFKKLMWKIELHWINGFVFFNKSWCDFAKEGKLCEGDICVLQKTADNNKLEVAVFEKKNVGNFNKSGVTQGKSVMKFMKVVNACCIQQCELDMPRLFVQEYGILLLEKVHLFLPDDNEFSVKFGEAAGQLSGLHKLLHHYSFKENYVIFFDYIGRSHFLLSVYTEKGEDVFGYLGQKVMLQDIMLGTDCPITRSSALDLGDADVHYGDGNKSFSMKITTTNLEGIGFGLYIGQSMLDIFGKWTTGNQVKLVLGRVTVDVEVDRRVDILCFENGWAEFTSANDLKVGQVLKFVYRGNYTFEIYIDYPKQLSGRQL